MMLRLFFATDVHGSEICWKKFINAGKFYDAHVVILGGDMTGKALVPVVEEQPGIFRATWLEQEITVHGDNVHDLVKTICDRGYYPIQVTREEFEQLQADPEAVDRVFREQVIRTMERWIAYADEKLGQWGIKCFVCPGNDDMFDIDEVIRRSRNVELAEGRVIDLDSNFTLGSTGWSNPTPWKTYRECTDEDLMVRLRELVSAVPRLSRCILNLHAPPYGSGLDEAPELDRELRPRFAGRSLVPVGSRAVKSIIEECQPLLALVGHIHEAKGVKRMGRTVVINPGSSYEQGILLGAIVDLDPRKGVKQYVLTTG